MDTDSNTAEHTARLVEFVTAWRSLTHRPVLEANRLTAFLEAARDRLRALPPTSPAAPKLDRSALEAKLAGLRAALNSARSLGFGFNPWAVAGLRRKEVRASAVLASLWNPTMCGDAAMQFLDAFLRQFANEEALPSKVELDRGYVVRTEHHLLGDRTTRMDITIDGAGFVLVIEVKIDASEGKGDGETKQFDLIPLKTKAWAETRGNKRPHFVLLSPKKPKGFDGNHANWRSVSRAVHRYMQDKHAMPTTYSFHDHLLVSFARHIMNY